MSQILKALKQLQSETDGQGAPPTSDPPPQPAPVEAIAPVPVEAPPPAAEPSAVSEPIAKPEFIASGGALATTVVERLADARWRRQLDMLADALLAELPLAPPVTVMLTA